MKSTWIVVIFGLSIACLAGSYLLLPRVIPVDQPQVRLTAKSDTLALPPVTAGMFRQLAKTTVVNPGDTLGLVLKDRYGEVRDSLSAFAKTSRLNASLTLLPPAIREEILSMVKPEQAAEQRLVTKKEYVLKGIEREYLASEIMGAEDASIELLGRLTQLEDAGRSDSEEYLKLKRQLLKKREFLTSAKQRLAAQRQVSKPAAATTKSYPQLTSAQRARILSLSASLPIDTQTVFAPIGGKYYRPDSGTGYIIVSEETHVKPSLSKEKSESTYILKSDGNPILWGTAQRKDSVPIGVPTARELKVSIE